MQSKRCWIWELWCNVTLQWKKEWCYCMWSPEAHTVVRCICQLKGVNARQIDHTKTEMDQTFTMLSFDNPQYNFTKEPSNYRTIELHILLQLVYAAYFFIFFFFNTVYLIVCANVILLVELTIIKHLSWYLLLPFWVHTQASLNSEMFVPCLVVLCIDFSIILANGFNMCRHGFFKVWN